MTIRFLLPTDGPIDITVLKGQGEFVVRIACAQDDEDGAIYSLAVALSPLPGYGDLPGFELTFCVVAMRGVDDHQDYWDGVLTRGIFGEREQRWRVRSALMSAVGLLIDEAQPELVSMTTHAADLPPPALTKFDEICAVFAHRGFKAGQADPYHGQRIWMMVRDDEQHGQAELRDRG